MVAASAAFTWRTLRKKQNNEGFGQLKNITFK